MKPLKVFFDEEDEKKIEDLKKIFELSTKSKAIRKAIDYTHSKVA